MTTGYAISDIQSLLKDGATIDDDGNITIPEKVEKPKVVENVSESAIKIKEYLLNISKMNYSNYSSVISLELNDISLVDEGYIAYSAAGHGFGNEYPRVYFSSGEKIIIKRKENL